MKVIDGQKDQRIEEAREALLEFATGGSEDSMKKLLEHDAKLARRGHLEEVTPSDSDDQKD